MNIPAVTVIISCYKVANRVRQTIESVLAQLGVSIEVIMINDSDHLEILRTDRVQETPYGAFFMTTPK